jgi:hypothetical protein
VLPAGGGYYYTSELPSVQGGVVPTTPVDLLRAELQQTTTTLSNSIGTVDAKVNVLNTTVNNLDTKVNNLGGQASTIGTKVDELLKKSGTVAPPPGAGGR